jgi:hypothetical protein
VIDIDRGEVIASVESHGERPELAWLSRAGEAPLLVISTPQTLRAFRVPAARQ